MRKKSPLNNRNKHVLRYRPYTHEKSRKIPGFPGYLITNYGRVLHKHIAKFKDPDNAIQETYVLKLIKGNRGPSRYVHLVIKSRKNRNGEYIAPAKTHSRSVSKIFHSAWPELERPIRWEIQPDEGN